MRVSSYNYYLFFNPRVLRAHGGSGYTFGALAILEPEAATHTCAASPEACQSPPFAYESSPGARQFHMGLARPCGDRRHPPHEGTKRLRGWLPSGGPGARRPGRWGAPGPTSAGLRLGPVAAASGSPAREKVSLEGRCGGRRAAAGSLSGGQRGHLCLLLARA